MGEEIETSDSQSEGSFESIDIDVDAKNLRLMSSDEFSEYSDAYLNSDNKEQRQEKKLRRKQRS